MKKLFTSVIVGLLAIATLTAAVKKPLPPCKWAGLYLGLVDATSIPKGADVVRTAFWLTIETNYTVSGQDYLYDGTPTGQYYKGTISSAGAIAITNQTFDITAKGTVAARGKISGTFNNRQIGVKGTIIAYRDTLYP